jgi:hypothetical protein
MKRLIASFMFIATLSSFTSPSEVSEKSRIHSSKKLSLEIIRAVADQSESEFLALLPSVNDFHSIMAANAGVYGEHIAEAQKEFSTVYATQVVPEARKAFTNLLQQAERYSIDWRTIEVTGIDAGDGPHGTLSFVTVSIHFLSKGKPYSLVVDKSLVWNGQWKVSQYIRLAEG